MSLLEVFNSQNFDLVSVGVAVAGILILAISVFLSNPKSITSKTFTLFALVIVGYTLGNYLSSQEIEHAWEIWTLRGTIFFATWASFLQFQLFFIFPREQVHFPKWYTWGLIPFVSFISLLTLTPYVFSGVSRFASEGQAAVAAVGLLVPLFGLTSAVLVIGSAYLLIRLWVVAVDPVSKQQLLFIMVGYIITFAGILAFNVALPLITLNTSYLVFAPLWFFPFISCTAYTILRFRLFDVKTAAVSILSFLLAATVIFQTIFSTSIPEKIFGASQFVLVVVFSLWLIRATTKEVGQREHIQMLAEELLHANERLKELDKLKSQFLSIATHELRTPLTIVRNFISLMLDGTYGKMPPAVEESGRQVFLRVTDMARSVDTYLNVSRIEQGQMKYDFADADLTQLVQKTVEAMKSNAEKKGLTLSFTTTPGAESLKAKIDGGKITEVVSNLIDNSIKYTETGSISLTLQRVGVSIGRLTIKDTGVGMSQKTMNNLFKLFSPGEDSKKINPASTGVGLYISRAHVEGHKGSLTASSPGEGKGSQFVMELPIL